MYMNKDYDMIEKHDKRIIEITMDSFVRENLKKHGDNFLNTSFLVFIKKYYLDSCLQFFYPVEYFNGMSQMEVEKTIQGAKEQLFNLDGQAIIDLIKEFGSKYQVDSLKTWWAKFEQNKDCQKYFKSDFNFDFFFKYLTMEDCMSRQMLDKQEDNKYTGVIL